MGFPRPSRAATCSPQDDRKDELLKTPPASEQRTTPLGSSDPSATIDLPKGMDFGEARLAELNARYELEAELGRGGMGIVYRARDKETGERVALKVLKPEIAGEQALLDRFKNELKLARKITHKRVCRTYELLRFGDTVVIAMEYVEGESLRAVLDRFGGLPLRKGIEVAQQVCRALGEAHAQGIVHRDLKPENLMLNRAGNVKVMDFGIARSVETGSTTTGGVIGTPAYMAPEQAEGKPVDARTDIYSLGLVLYEMFTGAAPFRADTPLALAMKQIRETPPAPREVEPTLPVHVEKAIVKCLEKNPAKRFQSVGELEAALTREAEATVAPEKAAGEEVPLPLHLTRWQRSDWAVLAVGGLAAVLSFVLYDRVLPYGASEVLIPREEALRRAGALCTKYATGYEKLKFNAQGFEVYSDNFRDSVLALGLEPSLEAVRETHSWSVFGEGPNPDTTGCWMAFNRAGRLAYLSLTSSSQREGLASIPATVQDALPIARPIAQDLFRAPVANLSPIPFVYDPVLQQWHEQGKAQGEAVFLFPDATPVVWALGDGKTRVLVMISRGRMSYASQGIVHTGFALWWAKPERALIPERWESAIATGAAVLGTIPILSILLFFARRLHRQRSRLALAAGLFPGLVSAFLIYSVTLQMARTSAFSPAWWLVPAASFVVALLVYYALFSVPEYYVGKVLPTHMRTASELLSRRLGAQSVGLAVVRGVLLGAAYLGLHLGLLLLLGNLRWGSASPANSGIAMNLDWVPALESTPGKAIWVSFAFSGVIIGTWLLVALPIGLLRRVTKRTPILLMAVALLWMAAAFSLPGAMGFPLFPLYFFAGLQGICFV